MKNTQLLLCYLLAAKRFGQRAGKIDQHFCFTILGITDLPGTVATLQGQGHKVNTTEDGGLYILSEVRA